jgi:hypothetical protein
MLKQLDPVTVLKNFNQIAVAGKQVVATDIPTSKINTMMELALKARELPVSNLGVVPPLIQPGDPDFGVIRRAVNNKIAASEAADAKAANPGPTAAAATPTPSASASPKAKKQATTPRTGQTNDLDKVCAG